MASTLRFILGDQLTHTLSSLADISAGDIVLMCEVRTEATYVPHNPKKIVFLFSAMRHFAQELRGRGIEVAYTTYDDAENTGSFRGELARAVKQYKPQNVIVTFPGEWRVLEDMRGWQEEIGIKVEIREDDRFFCSRDRFKRHAAERQGLRMEFFYRQMRLESGLLMEPGDKPIGGQWNFDKDNRRPLKPAIQAPTRFAVEPDAITREVMKLVGDMDHYYGTVDGFDYAVTARDAQSALDYFLKHSLPFFGDYQDAMRGQEELFHSVLSAYINAGLLDPVMVCKNVEAEYLAGRAPLNAAEGYIRQILGWREFVRGIYWLKMPDYAQSNFLEATRKLPEMYWNGKTDMNCMRHSLEQTIRTAHAHHIQRLMVLGNFALLAGIAPSEIEEWYLAVYIDAYDWVELPNVHGMVCHADGGVLGSKPYAASGKYINRMSDYCKGCRYDVNETTGETACPFNFLYWDFIARVESTQRRNPRMAVIYKSLDRMDEQRRAEITTQARTFLAALDAHGTDAEPFKLG